jgi:hypothetical protein
MPIDRQAQLIGSYASAFIRVAIACLISPAKLV